MDKEFFSVEDCDLTYESLVIGDKCYERRACLSLQKANALTKPLLDALTLAREALEVMRVTLARQASPHIEKFCKERAMEALARVEGILKASQA